MQVKERINPPGLQVGLAALGLLCLFGVLLGVALMIASPILSQQWQAGGALAVLCIIGWLALVAVIWLDQREVVIEPDLIVVRRWTDVMFNRPGAQLTRRGEVRAILYGEPLPVGVRLDGSRGSIKFAVNLWPTAIRERLPDILGRHGMRVVQDSGSF